VTFGLFPKAQLHGYSAFLILGAVMRRREFIALAGGAAFSGPLTAQAQQNVLPVVGILMGYGQSDPEAQSRLKALVDGLRELGWHEGENCKIEIRWAEADVPRTQLLARELVSLQPKVILANTTPVTAALQNLAVTQTTITWTRGGSSPQFTRVTFEYSTDNVNYTLLGNGTAGSSDWSLTGLNLPTGLNFYIRARGYYCSGYQNGSESITESVRSAFIAGPTPSPTPTATWRTFCLRRVLPGLRRVS